MSAYRKPTAQPAAKKPSRSEEKLRAFHEEDAIGKAYDARLARRIWPFVVPHARYLWISMGILLVLSAVALLRPLVMGDVIRQADARNTGLLWRDGLLLTGLVVLMQVLNKRRLSMSAETLHKRHGG